MKFKLTNIGIGNLCRKLCVIFAYIKGGVIKWIKQEKKKEKVREEVKK